MLIKTYKETKKFPRCCLAQSKYRKRGCGQHKFKSEFATRMSIFNSTFFVKAVYVKGLNKTDTDVSG